jgi:CRISPR-associated protein Cmr4
MNKSCLTFIHTLSPLHAGTGQGVGVIDLPIAREKSTNLPFLPGSTLKGTLRDERETALYNEEVNKGTDSKEAVSIARVKAGEVFGSPDGEDGKGGQSGSAIFSDQKLLCLPVRSLFGTFAWVTSPFILVRFKRDCRNVGNEIGLEIPKNIEIENCVVVANSALRTKIDGKDSVVLEDLDLTVDKSQSANLWAASLGAMIFGEATESEENHWVKLFQQRFCIVSDDVMNFLAETATEITARNVLNDNKTSDNLWYEESLPTETILSGVLATVSNRNAIDVAETVKNICQKPIQLGGNMTIGRGLCCVIIADGGGK